ncbi:hypothetical protein [Gallaecimonas xiamenensis]|uniref:Uncharacterized protein n=1 Tax=Gallaecimonas xiamenensis 3-C-1 TaxID=745411 RepID=K2J769_9GAMM|nr:hypothetical protein [Gallaecimonas xiamenensis]EKE70933.1 hypothetical protein B3C1_13094 [Gallaecimonas xiamenensis 3-C-1]
MATLDKDQVLADFTAAYHAKNGKNPEIEQKGSWYAIDGGKSVRLADIADMTAELTGGAAAPKAEPKKAPAKAAPKAAAKAPAKASKPKVTASNGGLLPKAYWEDLLEQRNHHCRRPRGF